jgi:hypothetical protein
MSSRITIATYSRPSKFGGASACGAFPSTKTKTHLFRGKTFGPSPPPAGLARRKAHCSQHRRTAEVAGHPIKIGRKTPMGKWDFIIETLLRDLESEIADGPGPMIQHRRQNSRSRTDRFRDWTARYQRETGRPRCRISARATPDFTTAFRTRTTKQNMARSRATARHPADPHQAIKRAAEAPPVDLFVSERLMSAS